ncbi:GIY-YIG nuclease family protein [Microcoleus sp. B3-D7]|uniref:GIY-YIG nuclease family protein n=1 Tax=Microcoleus sp. B3-D7 TaxID=2818659 RepID=UPI002FD0A8E4
MIHLIEKSTEKSTETSTGIAERVNGFFLGYLFAYLKIDIIRDEFSFVDFEKSTARLNINTRYRHHFSYKFYHSVVADPEIEGFVKTKEGNLDERSLLEWARHIEIISPYTRKVLRDCYRSQVKRFTQKQDEFKRLQYELQQKIVDNIFAVGDNFPLRLEDPTGIVYLIGCDRSQSLKIGYTQRDIKTRLRELQKEHHFPLRVLATREGTKKAEEKLLNRFKLLKIRGEWFEWDEVIIEKF